MILLMSLLSKCCNIREGFCVPFRKKEVKLTFKKEENAYFGRD